MKSLLPRSVLLFFMAAILTACANQQQQPEQRSATAHQQSSMVTAANETAAMVRLRAIAAAEASYGVESGGEYGTLDQLIQRRYINDPSNGKLTGYQFEIRLKPGGFQVTAVPEKFGVTGTRSFFVDETNVIRAADKKGEPATASDPEA